MRGYYPRHRTGKITISCEKDFPRQVENLIRAKLKDKEGQELID